MLQPGTCSAWRSSSITCVGPPGDRPTQSATQLPSSGNQIRPAHPHKSAALKRQGKVVEPVLIRLAVAVGVDDDLATGRLHPDVAGVRQTHVPLPNVTHPSDIS